MYANAVLSALSQVSMTGALAATAVVVLGVGGLVGASTALRGVSIRVRGTVAGLAVATSACIAVAVWSALRPLPPQLSVQSCLGIAVGLFGVFAAAVCLLRPRGRGRVALAFATATALLACGAGVVNEDLGTFPTLGAVIGHRAPPGALATDFAAVPGPQAAVQTGDPVASVWRRPLRSTRDGMLTHVEIPGAVSGFASRPALLYLPPAYLDSPRAMLPVLVLVAGNPGKPDDWLTLGALAETVTAFAAEHDGLAPVVVVPDALGATDALPLCLDSQLGNVDTYLARDVPDWIAGHLQVDNDPEHRAIGGFSYGGTCSVQLAVRHPDVYPTFVDISGQDEPSLGDHASTVAATFGGDESAFAAVNARDLLAVTSMPQLAGVFVSGSGDEEYRPQQQRMFAAARSAGMNVRYYELPGGHSPQVWGPALARELDWVAERTGLLAQ
ncbi:S-formylglutathione hydrolase FrmB [Rhodococcus sp. PvR044]|jgi:S-formylglutathione hydrolase FrmB|uniref:alpha/beta hydrolase n=1 Tax=unclassified Rhodococcus (in: high G+C Gram-positive bacteria) TaxID=192944 RepID=UPI000BDDA93E|nr:MULTISPECIES: alpha/beta hydrolase-fold protein [unclassified Rhodococcus (in: high G+C Gram-positive bacteria)]MBP1158375.1 S-formylglutathione hydrolase FrmB [Rhodococcus sp. PvR099]PTR43800.1 S-formylglutathione hydrolase FrmB [Rhodococcus sp. OK611]SNX90618.1 S-formylglutathione hydrolase FrmB [Rhodococcus sp. OK270]